MPKSLPPSLWPLVHRLAAAELWPPSGRDMAHRLVWQAEREGLLPLLFDAEDLPVEVVAALQAHRALRRLYIRRSELLEQASCVLGRLLEGEAVILLKGADYRRRLYDRPEHRPMRDVDLLVPQKRFDAVVELLERSGLEAHFPAGAAARLPSYHERVLSLGDVTVEVHHSFVQRVRHRIDYEAIWGRRVPLAGGPEDWARLEDADALVYHALSMAIDEFSVALIRYLDLWLMLESCSPALDAAVERARSWRAVRPLYGALAQLFRLFPESRSEARVRLARDLLSVPTRAFLDSHVLPGVEKHGKGKNMSRAVELWRKLWLLDGPWRRIRFALHHAGVLVTLGWLAVRRRVGRA